jgi:hypothetical protein
MKDRRLRHFFPLWKTVAERSSSRRCGCSRNWNNRAGGFIMFRRYLVFTAVAIMAATSATGAALGADKDDPLPEPLAKAKKAVSDELEKQKINGARVVPVQSDAVNKVLPDYQFIAVVFSPYPLARPVPKGFKEGNIYAASKDGTLKLLTTPDELQKFFAADAAAAKDEKSAKEALHAWLRLTEEFSQDGFFQFSVDADSLKIEKEKEGLKATGVNKVVPKGGDKGEIKATLTFDSDGKLTKVDETRSAEAGQRPNVLPHEIVAKPDKDKAEVLKDNIAQAELVGVGKVTGTIETGAGSFYYVTIELTEIMKGPKDVKTIALRVSSVPGQDPPGYSKKGTEGVWLLGKEGKKVQDTPTRALVTYLPAADVKAIREILDKKDEK